MAGPGAGSNKLAAQAMRDRLKAKVGVKRASEPAPGAVKPEQATGAPDSDGIIDSTGMLDITTKSDH